MRAPIIQTSIIRSRCNAAIETPFFRIETMKPHCPNCLKEMAKAAASRNLFACEPCREIIQYFGGHAEHGEPDPRFNWPIRRRRASYTAHAA